MGLSRANLETIATRTGRKVVAAWSTRNKGTMGDVVGVVMHHTGSAWGTAVAPTLGIVQNGRSDLQNALCNFYIDRAGTIYLITEKVAWHAGVGSWRGITDGNGRFLGIEPESDGVHWTAETVESYVRLVAEICRFLGADPNVWAIRHAQWAPGRKPDFSGLNEANFRARVAARLAGTSSTGDDDMSVQDVVDSWYGPRFRDNMNFAQVVHGMDDGIQALLAHLEGYGRRIENTEAQVTALTGAVAALASDSNLDAAAIKQAMVESLRENIVKVDVDVAQGDPTS